MDELGDGITFAPTIALMTHDLDAATAALESGLMAYEALRGWSDDD